MLIADHHLPGGADGSKPGLHGPGARTRNRVRQTIAEGGPITAAVLPSRLGLTRTAVHRHLDLPAEQGAIEARESASVGGSGRGRGRPARAYMLSEGGHVGMDGDYVDVAASSLRFLAEHVGADAVGGGTSLARAQLRQGHRPVQHVAAQFPTFCDAETDAFSRLLGVDGQRLTTRVHGDHVCTTFIPTSDVPVNALFETTTSAERSLP